MHFLPKNVHSSEILNIFIFVLMHNNTTSSKSNLNLPMFLLNLILDYIPIIKELLYYVKLKGRTWNFLKMENYNASLLFFYSVYI